MTHANNRSIKNKLILFSLQILVWCPWRKASICQSQQLSNTSVRTEFHKQNRLRESRTGTSVNDYVRIDCLLSIAIMDLSQIPGNSELFFSLLETRTENFRRDWSHFHNVQWHAHPSCQILQVFHKIIEFATIKLGFQFCNAHNRQFANELGFLYRSEFNLIYYK